MTKPVVVPKLLKTVLQTVNETHSPAPRIHFSELFLCCQRTPHGVSARYFEVWQGGYFFVVSLPVSAFPGIDDDGDGLLSARELRVHRNRIQTMVRGELRLISDKHGPRPIEGLLLNLPHNHGALQKPSSHIVAMGRFSVTPEMTTLRLQTTLFGEKPEEQKLVFKVTRGEKQAHVELSKQSNSRVLFTLR